jgi:hypothetical protein
MKEWKVSLPTPESAIPLGGGEILKAMQMDQGSFSVY